MGKGATMPNGLSGGFNISKVRLQSVLERFPLTEKLAEFAGSKKLDVTAGEMLEGLRDYKPWFDTTDDEVIVQEHYGSEYLIMLAPPPGATVENGVVKMSRLWFWVVDDSPLFDDLLDHHRRWLTQVADE